jgi:hypothetical protein
MMRAEYLEVNVGNDRIAVSEMDEGETISMHVWSGHRANIMLVLTFEQAQELAAHIATLTQVAA